MLFFPLLSNAQSLPMTAVETDAASLGTAGATLTDTKSVAYAAFGNPAAVTFSEIKMDGKLKHFVVSNFVKLFSCGNLTGVCCVNAVNVGIDLAEICVHRSGNGNCACIGAAAAEGSHIVVAVNALEARNDNDILFIQLFSDSFGINALDSCVTVVCCC